MRRSLLLVAAVLAVLAAAPAAGAAEGRIVVERAGRIDVIDPQGRPLGTLLRGLTGAAGVTWSADGARIAFVRDEAVWVAAADGTAARRLIDGGGASWAPDGRALAVTRLDPPLPGGGRHMHVWLVDVDSGAARSLPLPEDSVGASWFPDGRLVTTELVYGPTELSMYVTEVAADGSTARRLTNSGLDSSPVVSPDGARIAFASARDRNGESCNDFCHPIPELYVMNADGTSPQRLSRNVEHEAPLTWSPDAARIVAERSGNLVVLNVDGTCPTWLSRGAGHGRTTWLPGPPPGLLDCSAGPAFPPPPVVPYHYDASWLLEYTKQPVWWVGPRLGQHETTGVAVGDFGAVAFYQCRPGSGGCGGRPQLQTWSRLDPHCRPGPDPDIRAVRVRGRTAWYRSGSLLLPLGRTWVRISGGLPRALRFAAALRNGAKVGPHPRLDGPLPAPAPGMVDPDCPLAPAPGS